MAEAAFEWAGVAGQISGQGHRAHQRSTPAGGIKPQLGQQRSQLGTMFGQRFTGGQFGTWQTRLHPVSTLLQQGTAVSIQVLDHPRPHRGQGVGK